MAQRRRCGGRARGRATGTAAARRRSSAEPEQGLLANASLALRGEDGERSPGLALTHATFENDACDLVEIGGFSTTLVEGGARQVPQRVGPDGTFEFVVARARFEPGAAV